MRISEAFRATFELLGEKPLPKDAYERLCILERQIDPSEADRFGDLWEAFLAAGGREPGFPEEE